MKKVSASRVEGDNPQPNLELGMKFSSPAEEVCED